MILQKVGLKWCHLRPMSRCNPRLLACTCLFILVGSFKKFPWKRILHGQSMHLCVHFSNGLVQTPQWPKMEVSRVDEIPTKTSTPLLYKEDLPNSNITIIWTLIIEGDVFRCEFKSVRKKDTCLKEIGRWGKSVGGPSTWHREGVIA